MTPARAGGAEAHAGAAAKALGAPEQAVFLVGGRGERLGALTRETPKPLMDVAGRPFLHWLVEAVAGQGVRRLLFLTGYLAPRIAAATAPYVDQGLVVEHSVETEALGTGGALRHAHDRLAPSFWLLNGDSLFDVALADLVCDGAGATAPVACLALRHEADAGRYGAVDCRDGLIRRFAEKKAAAGGGLINGGVYWMRREILDGRLPQAFSLERDLFPDLAAQGRLAGRVFDAPFIDIGVPASLEAAQTYVPAALARRQPRAAGGSGP